VSGRGDVLTPSPPLPPLAQDSRLDIYRLLVEAGPGGLPVRRIALRLGLPSATLSFHLSQLRHAGLVSFTRDGRSLIYTANFAAMNDLLSYLTANCCAAEGGACGLDAEPAGSESGRPRSAASAQSLTDTGEPLP
jgi:ArsR family transcriptional regulator, arsenate/arsenite/antimonite-responsive transcriptional repressor